MQAIFRPSPRTEIVVSDIPPALGVLVEVYELSQGITPADVERDPINPGKKQLVCLQLARADARSIASAIMGCAANQQ